MFFLNGLTLSAYLVRLPAVKADLDLTDLQVGVQGAVFAAAALLGMQFTGRLATRFGTDAVLRSCLIVMPVLLAGFGIAHDLSVLVAVSALLGATHGMTDATMNAYAVDVERRIHRPILNGCHAAWSISAVIVSVGTASIAPSTLGLFLVIAVLVIVCGVVAGRRLVRTNTGPSTADGAGTITRRERRWSPRLVALGLVATMIMICEGATLGWGGIHLHEDLGASLALSALVVAVYTTSQSSVRLLADRFAGRISPRLLFRTGGLLAALGLGLAVGTPVPTFAVVGFGVLGLGSATLIPSLISAVGQSGAAADTTQLVSGLTTFIYIGILIGPAVIGSTAGLVGLPIAFACLVPLLALVALLCPLTHQPNASMASA